MNSLLLWMMGRRVRRTQDLLWRLLRLLLKAVVSGVDNLIVGRSWTEVLRRERHLMKGINVHRLKLLLPTRTKVLMRI